MAADPMLEKMKDFRKTIILPPKERLIETIKKFSLGPNSEKYLLESIKYESPSNIYWSTFLVPPIIVRGKGSRVWDIDGREYIDMMSGFSVANIGHCHPKVVKAITEQANKLMQWCAMPNDLRLELSKKLAAITPGSFEKRVHLLTTGGEAAELSLRAARHFTLKPLVIAFFGCYHGITMGAQNATTHPIFRSFHGFPLNIGMVHVPYAYCYRCFFGKTYPECRLWCAHYVDEILSNPHSGLAHPSGFAPQVAAMIVEPFLAASGYIIPPKEWLKELEKIARDHDVVLIVDEIQTGCGRSGKMWACEHSDVTPDIMLVAKAIAGGLPLSAVIAKAEILDLLGPGGFMSTYGGTPLACAAALAALEVMEEEKLVEQAREKGEYFLKGLKELEEKFEPVAWVNGRGLFIGLELVKDPKSKTPATEENKRLQYECMKRGLLYERGGAYGNIIKFIPPLTITKEEIDRSLEILEESLKAVF